MPKAHELWNFIFKTSFSIIAALFYLQTLKKINIEIFPQYIAKTFLP